MATLNEQQAMAAMRLFLERYQGRINSDDIAGLLGDISPVWGPGTTGDPAAWEEWLECVSEVVSKPEFGGSAK